MTDGPEEAARAACDAEADSFLGGRLHLRQPPRGAHRAGTDAVLLAHLVAPEPGDTVYDLGAATGAVGLSLARLWENGTVVLVEREAALVGRARDNIRINGLEARVRVVEADLLAPGAQRRAAGLSPGEADLVLTNPPFFETSAHRPSPNRERASAHSFAAGDLDRWLRACADLLRPFGRLGLIHRADALPACLDGVRGRFGDCAIRPVHARADRPAIRILLTAVKGSRAPLRLLPPLVLQDAGGRLTTEAAALHRGERWGGL